MAGRWSGKAADSSWCHDLPEEAQQAVKDMLAPASKVPDAQKQVWPPILPMLADCVLINMSQMSSSEAQQRNATMLQIQSYQPGLLCMLSCALTHRAGPSTSHRPKDPTTSTAWQHSSDIFDHSTHQLIPYSSLRCRVQLARVFAPFAPGNLATPPLADLPGLQDQGPSVPAPLSASFPTASKRQPDPSRPHVLDLTALDQESGRPASR